MTRSTKYGIFLFLLIVLVSLPHAFALDRVPCGLWFDESSIAYNAWLVFETGRDESGRAWPVFFFVKGAIRDVQHAPFIYAVGLVFRVFGPGEVQLRMTGVLFFALCLVALAVLCRRLFPNDRLYAALGVLFAGLLPWFFSVSRIAFEVNSQPVFVVLCLLFVFLLMEAKTIPAHPLAFVGLGLTIAASIYSYSTGRLLAPGMLLAFCLVYFRAERKRLGELALVGLGFAVGALPFVYYMVEFNEIMSVRANVVSFIGRDMPFGDKVLRILENYLVYFIGFKYLLLTGDPHLKHAAGGAGAFYFTVFGLGMAGVLLSIPVLRRDKYRLFLLLNLIGAPAAGAATYGEFQTLRAILYPVYVIIFALFAVEKLPGVLKRPWARPFLIGVIVLATLFEAGSYLRHYFREYPALSAYYFESWGLKQAYLNSLSRKPKRIVLISAGEGASDPALLSTLQFYNVVTGSTAPPVVTGAEGREAGVCYLRKKSKDEIRRVFFQNTRECSEANSMYTEICY